MSTLDALSAFINYLERYRPERLTNHECNLLVREVRALQARETRMREALEFYADEQFWNGKVVLMDAGARARAALAGLPDTGSDQ